MDRYFWHLSTEQADGVACVVCGRNFLQNPVNSTAVGREPATDSQVFACVEPCAQTIAQEAVDMARELWAAAGLTASTDGADVRALGADGTFGELLRDLRVLVGVEALLGVINNVPTIQFLLQMTGQHAEAAQTRARHMLARIRDQEDG